MLIVNKAVCPILKLYACYHALGVPKFSGSDYPLLFIQLFTFQWIQIIKQSFEKGNKVSG